MRMQLALSDASFDRVRALLAQRKGTLREGDLLRALSGDGDGVDVDVVAADDEETYASYARMTGVDVDDGKAAPADPDEGAYRTWAREAGIS